MSEKPIPLFVNPAAGRGRATRKFAELQALLEQNGVATLLTESNAPGDLEEIVFSAVEKGGSQIIVAGGDGSVHEAVNGIMRSAHAAALGVVPLGTGNDFAKACGIPLNWHDAAALLADRIRSEPTQRFVDIGQMNERYFANGAGIGFDAKVNHIAKSIHWPIGDLVYLVAVFRAMWDGVITPELEIRTADHCHSGPLTLANISNGAWVGGIFHIAPMAKNDDGELDLICAAPVSRLRILALLPALMQGSHIQQPEISHSLIQHCDILARSPVPSHLDGEVQPLQTRFHIEVLQSALQLL